MGVVDHIAHEAPLPLVGLGILAAMIAAREVGAAAHRWLRGSADSADPGSSDEAHILTAVLGLLALLVAFTFSLSLDRYETRRELVITEANALGTAYLRTAILDDPAPLRTELRDYARERLAYGRAAGRDQDAAAERANRLQVQIWRDATAAVQPVRSTATTAFVLGPMNEAFDAAASRKAALAARLPTTVLLTLAIYSVIAAGMLGYTVAGAGGRHRIASILMFTLLTLAIVLILDLDRPRGGAIQVPQTAMADALAAMDP